LGAAQWRRIQTNGNLTYRLAEAFPANYETLRINFNNSMEKLRQAMLAISAGTEAIAWGAGEVSIASDDLSHRAELSRSPALVSSRAELKVVPRAAMPLPPESSLKPNKAGRNFGNNPAPP